MKYDHKTIEAKWQKLWRENNLYRTDDDATKEKYYVLDMFPYPSGEGLHVGHPKGYIATDIIARQKMMEGKAVLHPMGWDAFGLPAENYAIKNKVHPSIAVAKNIERFKDQLGKLGFTYDWEREVNTTDPNFYKWTQWIFVQLFNKGLAYESFEPINWCPSCKTGLANEDLEDGRCERCGSVVEKKPMRQWVLKITDYAERLLRDLDTKVLNTGDFLETLSNGEKSFIQMTGPGIIQPDKPFVERPAIAAIVQHWKDDSFIVLKWKKVDWHTLVTGGIEEGQSMEEAARAEILEETGYKNLRLVKRLDEQVHGTFFHVPKNENRLGHFFGFHFQLENDEHVKIDDNEHEKHEVQWVTREEVQAKLTASTQQYIWSRLMNEPFVLDTSKDLLDWPESIKESQRNWIGKSEGAEIDFSITGSADKITVFTTRIDTLFGASYVVLAPEHPLIHKLEDTISNLKEVKKYIEAAAKKTEIDRTAEGKEKTGVELKGLKAINPATGEEIPIWIADYVLGDYGTGAVMAVPMHDDRDFAFAKEYDLPIKQVIAPSYGVPRQNETLVKGVCGAIYDPETKKFAVLEWGENNNQKLHGLYGMYGGGSEGEESFEEAVRREVLEESGLYDFKLIEPLWFGRPHYFNAAKNIARDAEVCCFLMIINSRDQKELKHEDHETFGHGWHTAEELITNWTERNINQDFDHWIDFIKRAVVRLREHSYSFHDDFSAEAYTGEGFLCNSGKYDGLSSAEARQKIVKDLGGRAVVRYKLRDWVFSRQRYWGEPIPIIHCADCGAVAVPEKDLPVVLPEVEYYEPTGTGESPLAGIEEWVNTTCPKCGKAGKRETNTMPQWAGSSWYYLRYIDPNNKESLVDKSKEKHWSPVDMYVGGAEHATRHLIYARFWHKFLFDIGTVNYPEPFVRYINQGLIMGADGRKMGKRYGNVVNPDDMVERYSADAFRVYEMFLSPFGQSASFLENGVAGAQGFLNRIIVLKEKIAEPSFAKASEGEDKKLLNLLHNTIKKTGEDINNFKFNTAVSGLMILANALSDAPQISLNAYKIFIKLLAPFAPHLAEELWQSLGETDFIFKSSWPHYDQALLQSDTVTIVAQVNGKVRDTFEMPAQASEEEIKAAALERPQMKKWLDGKEIKKIIVVKGKVVNIVI